MSKHAWIVYDLLLFFAQKNSLVIFKWLFLKSSTNLDDMNTRWYHFPHEDFVALQDEQIPKCL